MHKIIEYYKIENKRTSFSNPPEENSSMNPKVKHFLFLFLAYFLISFLIKPNDTFIC
jgi:hypothetical protein